MEGCGMSLSTKLLIVVALFLAGIALGWHLRGNADANTTLAKQKQEVTRGNDQNSQDAASAEKHESGRQKTVEDDRHVTEQVAVAAAAPDYHTCHLKPQDMVLLNQAIGGRDVQGK
jgi:outer membrane lipopolysaccharide assembly protein LptE/RlpB